MKLIHVLLLVLTALAGAIPGLEAAFPTALAPLQAANTVLVLVLGVLAQVDPPAPSRLARRSM